MMLANDGHEVTLLERDAEAPPSPDAAWEDWERRGVNQFKMLHFFLSRFRLVAEMELPGLIGAMEAAGALRMNPMDGIPDEITRRRVTNAMRPSPRPPGRASSHRSPQRRRD